MIFRGLPTDLHCGYVELEVVSETDHNLPACVACSFVPIKSTLLSCNHSYCDECLLIDPESVELSGRCLKCNQISPGEAVELSRDLLESLTLKCPCGFEGELADQRLHRYSCVSLKPSDLPGSSKQPQSIAIAPDRIKQILLKELQHIENDIVNNSQEVKLDIMHLTSQLEARMNVLEARHTVNTDLQRRLAHLEEAVQRTSIPREIQRRLESLENQSLPSISPGEVLPISVRSTTMNAMYEDLLWFNVRDLLRRASRRRGGQSPATKYQTAVIGGYPLCISLLINSSGSQKMLAVAVGVGKTEVQAVWPMRRKITIKLYSTSGNILAEETMNTASRGALNTFASVNSQTSYAIENFIPIDSLLRSSSYVKTCGMICLGISVTPLAA